MKISSKDTGLLVVVPFIVVLGVPVSLKREVMITGDDSGDRNKK